MKMRDPIEQIFQKYLKKQSPEKEGWNTPSDDLWGKIESELPLKNEDKRPGLWIGIGIILLFLGLSASFIWLYSLQKKLEYMHSIEPKSSLLTNEDTVQPNRKDKLISSDNKRSASSDRISTIPRSTKKRFLKDNAGSKSYIDPTISYQRPFVKKQILRSASSFGKLQEKENCAISDKVNTPTHSIMMHNRNGQPNARIATLPSLSTRLQSEGRDYALTMGGIAVHKSTSKPNELTPLSIIMYTGLSASSAPIKGEMAQGYERVLESNKMMPTYHVGIELLKGISSHWSIRGGLNYLDVSLWSYSDIEATYDPASEQKSDNGMMKSTQRFSVPSHSGMRKGLARLQYPQSMGVSKGEIIEGNIDIVEKYHILKFPLGIQYALPLPSRWSVYTGAGVSWNWVMGGRAIVREMSIKNKQSMEVEALQLTQPIIPNYIEWQGRAGAHYRMNSQTHLLLETEIRRSVRPILDIDQMKSHIFGYDLRLGVSYRI